MPLSCGKIRYYDRVLLHLNLHKTGFIMKFPIAGKTYLFISHDPSKFLPISAWFHDQLVRHSGDGRSFSRTENPLWMFLFSYRLRVLWAPAESALPQRPFPFCKAQGLQGDVAALIVFSERWCSQMAGIKIYLVLRSENETCFHRGLDETPRTDQC